MKIKLSKRFECAPRGNHVSYEAGEYMVPEEMPSEIAKRAKSAGVGQEVLTVRKKRPRKKRAAPENKILKEADENKDASPWME